MATSELSQDAFITWLIQWANKDLEFTDKELYNCALEFIRSIIGENQSYEIGNYLAAPMQNYAIVNNFS